MNTAISEAILLEHEKASVEIPRYSFKGIIGQGVYGTVFKAKDTVEKKLVAIKVSKSNDKTLRNEIEILKYIFHANVKGKEGLVQLKDQFRIDRKLHVVYEMLGKSVDSYIRQHPMTIRTIRKVAFGLCRSLSALSEIGIIHGDLKLDNIVFSGKSISDVKIIDFGLAQICKKSTSHPIQALDYRAPEVLLEMSYGKEVDMWSVGCILFALLTQQTPAKGPSEENCMIGLVRTFGMPPTRMIASSRVWSKFFEMNYNFGFELKNKTCEPRSRPLRLLAIKSECDGMKNVNDQVIIKPRLDILLNLIERMFTWEPEKRMTPTEALYHPFFRD